MFSKEVMRANSPTIDGIHFASAYIDWSWAGGGFGQLSFRYDCDKARFYCQNECMGRESVRAILVALANHIADTVVLEDEHDSE